MTFLAPDFIFWAGSANARSRRLFHFHAITIGLGGYPQLTHNIVLDGLYGCPQIIGAKDVAS